MGNSNRKGTKQVTETETERVDTGKALIHDITSIRNNSISRDRIQNNSEQKQSTLQKQYVSDDNSDDAAIPTMLEVQAIDLKRQKFNPFMTDMRIYTGDDIKTTDVDIASFEFGELFGYWDDKSPSKIYIAAQQKSLKAEITNSKNHTYLDNEAWQEFVTKATHIYNTMYAAKSSEYVHNTGIYAKNKPYFNKLFCIKAGSKMTIEHILAVILYTDTNDLQKYFKQQSRKMQHTENMLQVAAKNRKYANWFRLLFEAVWIFGDELRYNKKVYHGINCKLLFNKFEYDFKSPLSTTYDLNIATGFCQYDGIILELRNGESEPQPFFDVAKFSRYPESEYLFFGATLKITSIMMADAKSGKYVNYFKQIEILNFYMHIMNGNEIERFSATHCKNNETHIRKVSVLCQRTLKLVNKHIQLLKNESTLDLHDDYIWKLFLNFTATNNIIWINKNELRYLKDTIKCRNNENIDLVNKFIVFGNGANDEFGEYLKLLHMKVCYAVEWEWNVKNSELTKLKNGETERNGIMCYDYWDYFIDGDQDKMCTFGGNMVAGYNYEENEEKEENEEIKVGFYWRLSAMPKEYKSVIVSVELYCPQIEFYIQFFNIKMARNGGLENTGHTSLFPLSELDNLDTFQWRIIMKCRPVENDTSD